MHVCEEAVKKLKVVSIQHMLGFFHSSSIPVIATEKTNKTQGDLKKKSFYARLCWCLTLRKTKCTNDVANVKPTGCMFMLVVLFRFSHNAQQHGY